METVSRPVRCVIVRVTREGRTPLLTTPNNEEGRCSMTRLIREVGPLSMA